MSRNCFAIPTLSMFVLSAILTPVRGESPELSSPWPQWRGANQNGVAPGNGFPQQWSESESVLWNARVPGSGGSTPVVAAGHVYVTAGEKKSENEGVNTLFAFDAGTGKETWRVALGGDTGGKHRKGSGSNPSAVTDGKNVYAYFRSGDLACVSVAGEIRWKKNLQELYGEDTLWWDLGSSPLLTENAIIVAVMQTGPSYLVAFDPTSGDELWKTKRDLDAPEEAAQSYSTPLAVTIGSEKAIAVMGADHLTLHALSDGRELGRLGGFNPGAEKYFRSISSPVALGNIIVCPYARGDTLTAVRMDDLVAGKGKESIAWFRDDLGSDVPTPAALDGRVFVAGDKGLISCLDIKNGKTLWQVELPKSRMAISSSPLVAGNQLYVTREDATTYVIGPLDQAKPEIIATNQLADDEPFTVASLVPVENDLLLRSKNTLHRIGD